MEKNIKLIAYYLPQFHEIPENDQWWGKGFTEWTNVKKAKPIFKDHYQPRIPGELGYYNLLDPIVINKQAEIANRYGINGFCWYHYWFGDGKRLLEKPSYILLENKSIKMPFFFCWANETWSGVWFGAKNKILMEQKYCGNEDDKNHFYALLPFFKDYRYLRHNDKPIFYIYQPHKHPYLLNFIHTWQKLAQSEGLPGIFFLGLTFPGTQEFQGLDGYVMHEPYFKQLNFGILDNISRKYFNKYFAQIFNEIINGCHKMSYSLMVKQTCNYQIRNNQYPTILSGWDNTPRCGKSGRVFYDYTPELFEIHLRKAIKMALSVNSPFCFIKSWNEWAEGNYLEPDNLYGNKYLEIITKVLKDIS